MRLSIMIIMIIMMAGIVSAKDITMKTNEIYTAQFEVRNIDDGDTLRDCIPYLSGDLEDQPFMVLQPSKFDLQPGESQVLQISIQEPPVGYYQDELNVRCTRYLGNEFIGAGDIISSPPTYKVLVKLAGEGQAYSIIPTNGFFFFSKPPSTEKATFKIANTGSTDLDMTFEIPAGVTNVRFDPIRATIPEGTVQLVTVTINTDAEFKSMKEEIPLKIGDFGDVFTIEGEKESLASGGGAAITSIAFGNVEVQGTKIPGWLIIIVLAVAFYFVYQEQKKGGK